MTNSRITSCRQDQKLDDLAEALRQAAGDGMYVVAARDLLHDPGRGWSEWWRFAVYVAPGLTAPLGPSVAYGYARTAESAWTKCVDALRAWAAVRDGMAEGGAE